MNHKLSLKEKVSYGLGDTASNLMYAVITTYLTFYYTDVYGIGIAAVGTLMLVVRFIDMLDSPIFGILIDKTNTRWGKSRPWILWSCFPFAISSVLLFLGPEFSDSGKLVYAYITYILVSICYSAVNNPISTMLPSLSNDNNERTSANIFRMLGGQTGGLIVNLTLLTLVAYFGGGNQQKGFLSTMILFAVVGLVMFLITFKNTNERVQSASSNKSIKLKDSIKAIKGNKPWFLAIAISVIFFITYVLRSSAAIYYLTYYVEKPEIVTLINSLAMFTILGIILIFPLSKLLSKRTIMIIGFILFIVGQLTIYAGGTSTAIIALGTIIGSIGLGFPTGLLFTLMADTVEYGEWKSGVRAQGLLIASASGIGIKLGSGLGAAIPAWILSAGGYVANQTQTASALNAIEISFIWVSCSLAAIGAILMVFYKFEKPFEEIMAELDERRQKEATLQA